MNPYIEIKAATLDEAITKAMIELEATSDELDYEVTDKGSSGFLGIGARKVAIRARKKETPEETSLDAEKKAKKEKAGKPEKAEKPAKPEKTAEAEKPAKPEKADKKEKDFGRFSNPDRVARPAEESADEQEPVFEQAAAPVKKERVVNPVDVTPCFPVAETFLQNVFKAMDLTVSIDMKADEEVNTIDIDLKGDDMGILIGKRGQTLDALQYLTSIVVNAEQTEYIRVKVDTENYRMRRKETLENLAGNLANKVKRTGKPVTLEPMNAYERRIIHSVLQQNKYVETHSEGEEPFRKVIVMPSKDFKPYPNNRRRGNNNYRGGRKGGYRGGNRGGNHENRAEQSDSLSIEQAQAKQARYEADQEQQ